LTEELFTADESVNQPAVSTKPPRTAVVRSVDRQPTTIGVISSGTLPGSLRGRYRTTLSADFVAAASEVDLADALNGDRSDWHENTSTCRPVSSQHAKVRYSVSIGGAGTPLASFRRSRRVLQVTGETSSPQNESDDQVTPKAGDENAPAPAESEKSIGRFANSHAKEPTDAAPDANGNSSQGRRDRWAFAISIVTALVALLGILPALIILNVQISSLKSSANLAETQRAQAEADINSKLPHLEVRWIDVHTDQEPVLARDLLVKALAGKENLRVMSPQASGLTLQSENPSLVGITGEFAASKECRCADVKKSVVGNKYRLGFSAVWTFLVVAQNGGQSAYDVTLSARKVQPGELGFYNLEDLYEGGQDSAEVAVEYKSSPIATLNIGTMQAGTQVAVPMFASADVIRPSVDGTDGRISLSEGFIPDTLKYRAASSNQPEEVEVRAPARDPLLLAQGVLGRG
jgi:hypothetical protein